MKAIVTTRYGSPDVLRMQEVEKPAPTENRVLVKVKAVALNPFEWHHLRGKPYLMRFGSGLLKPKHAILGNDVAGYVENVGAGVTGLKPGDEVFAASGYGALAEYVVVKAENVVPKPANASFEEAAGLPIAGLTALQCLRDHGVAKAGQKVVINGASGGVGTYAVQIAKAFGAEVTGICSGRNAELVRSLGADYVVDYTREDFSQSGITYNLIVDTIGNLSLGAFRRALAPGGIGVVAGFTNFGRLLPVVLFGKSGAQKVALMGAATRRQDLLTLGEMVESGQIKTVIDRTYAFEQTAEAIRYLETGRARGKVVVSL